MTCKKNLLLSILPKKALKMDEKVYLRN